MNATATQPRLLTVDEVAERLGVHRITVYRRIARGDIPAVRLGGHGAPLRVDADELERWLYGQDR